MIYRYKQIVGREKEGRSSTLGAPSARKQPTTNHPNPIELRSLFRRHILQKILNRLSNNTYLVASWK